MKGFNVEVHVRDSRTELEKVQDELKHHRVKVDELVKKEEELLNSPDQIICSLVQKMARQKGWSVDRHTSGWFCYNFRGHKSLYLRADLSVYETHPHYFPTKNEAIIHLAKFLLK